MEVVDEVVLVDDVLMDDVLVVGLAVVDFLLEGLLGLVDGVEDEVFLVDERRILRWVAVGDILDFFLFLDFEVNFCFLFLKVI